MDVSVIIEPRVEFEERARGREGKRERRERERGRDRGEGVKRDAAARHIKGSRP